MIKRVIVAGLVALTLLGAGIAIGASTHDGWRHHGDAVVVSGAGTSAGAAGQTIVVTEGHGPPVFFFPFGLLFLVFVVLLLASAFRRRSGRGCGPGGPGGPAWLGEWHRRAHEHEDGSSPSTTA